MQKKLNYLSTALRIVAAAILIQTLYFKFTGAPESKFIFSTLGVEPWGRWFAGTSELIASILLLLPATQILGALMAVGIMVGAIVSHIAILGIEVQDDGGLLFTLACVVLVASLAVLLLERRRLFKNIATATEMLRGLSKREA
jgi:putative oxidoreductase